jgi:sulfur-oxidizing protein SoxY
VDVVSAIPNTTSIAVFVEKNPQPLTAVFNFSNGALPEVRVAVKMGQTSNVKVVAKTADGKFYSAQKEVKVTTGGCGG